LALCALFAWFFGPRALVGYDLYQARRALAKPDVPAALRFLTAAEKREPDRAEVQYMLAAAFRRGALFKPALEHLERAKALGYPRRELERQEMMLRFQMGDVDELGPALTELLKRGGSDEVAEEVYEAMVLGYFSEYHIVEAEMILNHWLEWRPDSVPARLYLVRLYLSHGIHADSPQLEKDLRAILEIDSQQLDARLLLTDFLMHSKRLPEALAECEILRKQEPSDPRVGIELGLCHFQLGHMDESRREIEGSIERVKDANLVMQGLITLGQIAAADQDWQRAVEHYTSAVRLRPYDAVANYSLGTAMSKLGKSDEGEEQLRRYKVLQDQQLRMGEINDALVQDAGNVELRLEMATILIEQGRQADAAFWMLSVLRYDPNRREANEMLADFYEEAGKVRLANEYRDAARSGAALASPADNSPRENSPRENPPPNRPSSSRGP
jgi:tetratricopeptide (TPR) repeat protein